MYSVIKTMIKAGATHKWDRPDLLQEWGSAKKTKNKLLFCQKMILSIKKISEQNLEMLPQFDTQNEIKDRLISDHDRYLFDFHINGYEREDEQQELALNPDISKLELLRKLQSRQATKSQLYFSISDEQKVQKFLLKIEQCLFKNFGFDQKSFLETVYN